MAGAAPDAGIPTPGAPAIVEAPERVTAVVAVAGFPADRLPLLFDAVFTRLFPALGQAGVRPVGAAFALYPRVPDPTVDLEVGIPVDRVLEGTIDLGPLVAPGQDAVALEARTSALPGGRIATAVHHGGYDTLGQSWQTLMGTLASRGTPAGTPFWEVYTTEPTPDMDPATLRTDLFTALAE